MAVTQQAPTISVLIVTYNSEGEIVRCLRSLNELAKVLPIETIVVDNCSRDATVKILQSTFPSAHLIAGRQNIGFGRAANLASRKAAGKYLLILNPDTEIYDPQVVVAMHDVLEANQATQVAGCRLVTRTHEIQPFSYYLPSVKLTLSQLMGFKRLIRLPGARRIALLIGGRSVASYLRSEEVSSAPRAVEVLSGACALFRSEIFSNLGGFDENIFLYMEDTDLFFRMKHAGYQAILVPELGVMHEAGASFNASFTAISPAKYWSTLYYFRKNHTNITYLLIRGILLISTLLKGLFRFTHRTYLRDCMKVVAICIKGPDKWSPFPQ